ncbi:lipopolysaccharide biosynthesis protein [Microbacterium testaceum]|uniref:lipopolysaccharide biosynthesis protein n=1 Tax=Microbacterium testaceum TaxID=2033 RepID=UPI00177AD5AB|nr:lipopolysaccharide biosynthesis protein [Microbacterium testaceum]
MRKQVLSLITTRGLSGAAQATALILLARNSSTTEFAIVSVISGIAVFVCAIADLGLAGFISKAQARGDTSAVRTALRANLLSTSSLGLVFAAAAGLFTPGGLSLVAILLAAGFFLEKNADTLLGVAIADGNTYIPSISIIGRRLINLSGLWIAVAVGWDAPLAYAASYVAGGAFAQAVGSIYARRTIPTGIKGARSIDVLRPSSHYMWTFLAGQSRLLDAGIVAFFAGSEAAAKYAAVTRLAQPALIIPGAIGTVMLPHAARNSPSFARLIAKRLLLATAVLAALCGPVALFGTEIVRFVLGETYADTGSTLALSLYAILFLGAASPMTGALQGLDDERFVVIASLALAVMLLGSVAVGSVAGGVVGAAVGLCIASLVRWITFLTRLFRFRTG